MNKLARRGSSLLEFALATGILVPLFTGTFQFGYTLYVYNDLQSAVRGGARYASMRSYDSANSTPSAGFLTAVRNMVVYGNPNGTGQPVAPGLSPSNVEVLPNMNGAAPESITVQITGYTVNAVFTRFTFNGKPGTTFPYTGTPAPHP
jgi:Flp pilus assembly protein TadG